MMLENKYRGMNYPLLGKKKVMAIINMWADSEEEAKEIFKKFSKVIPSSVPIYTITPANFIAELDLRHYLGCYEIDKLCNLGIVDVNRGQILKDMLHYKWSSSDDCFLSSKMVQLLREQRVNTDYA